MKTHYKGIKTGAEALVKRKQLEAKTGLKLSCYSAHGGYVFTPYLHDEIEPKFEKAQMVYDSLPDKGYDAVSFAHLAKKLKLPVIKVLEASQLLVKNGVAMVVVGRGGKVVGIYKQE